MITKSPNDDNKYTYATLANGLRVVFVTNKVKKSAAALTVKTGAIQDTIPGIAHFLEHMLFMGTEPFPNENDFMDFLSKHNGHCNACTNDDFTICFFEIDSHYFEEALIKLSHFFKMPLLKEDNINREINAVDSEFKNRLYDDSKRINIMRRYLMIDEFKIFPTGNKKTLNIEGIRDKVLTFYKTNYCSSEMRLTIFHNKENRELVENNFSDVPQIKFKKTMDKSKTNDFSNINIESNEMSDYNSFVKAMVENDTRQDKSVDEVSFESEKKIFKKLNLNRIIHIEPVADIKRLQIHVQVPKETSMYKNGSYNFICYLLQKTNEYSLFYNLRQKKYTCAIDVRVVSRIYFSFAVIRIELTAAGYENIEDVLLTLKNYLINLEFDKEEYIKYRKSRRWEFEYVEKMNADDTVINISEAMQFYEIRNLLDHNYLYEEFNLDELNLIKDIIEDSNNWLIFSLCKDRFIKETKHSTEKYYKIKYIVDENLLVLSTPNKFFENEDGRFSFIFNDSFKAPKTCVTILLNRKISREEYVPFLFYINLVKASFYEKYGDFLTLNNLGMDVKLNGCGVEIEFFGFNNNLCPTIQNFFKEFLSFNFDDLNDIKIMLKANYITIKNRSPYQRLCNSLFESLNPKIPSVDCILKTLETIKQKDIYIFKNCYLEMFISGNNSSFAFEKIYNDIKKLFSKKNKYRPKNNYSNQSIQFQSEDPINNAVGVFVKFNHTKDYRSSAINELILDYCKQDFFDTLRTKETLGYVVHARNLVYNGTSFLYFVVQSKKSCKFLEKRILRFIKDLRGNLKKISKDDFISLQNSVLGRNNEEIKNLKAFHSFYKELCFVDAFDLEYKQNMANEILSLTIEDLVLPNNILIVKGMSKK